MKSYSNLVALSSLILVFFVLVYTHSVILVIFKSKSNLIGSLSRTIQQCSPPSEWIMCELGVFPIFFRGRSFKSRQNPRVAFFKAREDLKGFKMVFFHLL